MVQGLPAICHYRSLLCVTEVLADQNCRIRDFHKVVLEGEIIDFRACG